MVGSPEHIVLHNKVGRNIFGVGGGVEFWASTKGASEEDRVSFWQRGQGTILCRFGGVGGPVCLPRLSINQAAPKVFTLEKEGRLFPSPVQIPFPNLALGEDGTGGGSHPSPEAAFSV